MNIEQLKKEYREEENDLKALGLMNKILREERVQKFTSKYLGTINESEKVIYVKEYNNKFEINFYDFGVIDFYPKANKVLIRRTNKWIKPGLKWIISKI